MKLWLTRDKDGWHEDVELWQGKPTFNSNKNYYYDKSLHCLKITTFCRRPFECRTGIKLKKGEIVELVDVKLKIKRIKQN